MTAIGSPNYRWRVGEVEITRVLEFEAALFEPAVIHPEASLEIIERHRIWLAPRFMDPVSGLLIFAFHSTVIKTPRATILVDTCSGNDKERPHKPRYHRKNWPYLANLAGAGFCARTHRLCAVHASARRSRRLEHPAPQRPMGADLPECSLPVRSRGMGALAPARNGSTGGWLN